MPETLRQRMSQGPIDSSAALDILRQLLEALEFAHWRGVIYGDIAPERVVLPSDGETPPVHFGVAHQGDRSAPITAGTFVGNPGYMAPEQMNGDPADERTDIFALGVVAFEMLACRHPFGASDGLSAGYVMDRILHELPLEMPQATLAALPSHIPPVLNVALAKDPNDRFPNAISFLEALKGTTADADVVVPEEEPSLPRAGSHRTPRLRQRWLIGFVLAGLAVAVLVVFLVVTLGEDAGLSSSSTVTSGGTTSTGQSVAAIVPTTTTTGVPPTTTTTARTTTTTVTTTTTASLAPTRSEQTDSRLVYAGAWSTSASGSASEGGFLFANSSVASVTITFEGTYLAWIAKKSPIYGKAEVTLDGKRLGTIDLYSASTEWQHKVWGTGTLKSGLHSVTIAWTGSKNTAATGTNICVDAFDVAGSLTQVP